MKTRLKFSVRDNKQQQRSHENLTPLNVKFVRIWVDFVYFFHFIFSNAFWMRENNRNSNVKVVHEFLVKYLCTAHKKHWRAFFSLSFYLSGEMWFSSACLLMSGENISPKIWPYPRLWPNEGANVNIKSMCFLLINVVRRCVRFVFRVVSKTQANLMRVKSFDDVNKCRQLWKGISINFFFT